MIRLVSSVLLLLCVACQAPLASTAHEVVDQSGFAGSWELTLHLPAASARPDGDSSEASEAVPLGRLEVTTSGSSKPAGDTAQDEDLFSQITRALTGDADQGPERLELLLHPMESDDDGEPGAPTRYDAQILRVDGRLFLTAQRFAHHDRLDIWTTPLQRTFLMEATDEPGVVWLSMHPKQFVWSPAAYAGTFEFDPDALDDEGGTALVRRFDDVLDYYAARPDDEWQRMFRAKRLD